MAKLHQFIVEDVRCFQGEHRANIRPITLLVGENSTGKTSFLGGYRVLCHMLGNFAPFGMSWESSANFNLEPFQMGAFRDIVRSKRGKNGKDKFVLGCRVSSEDKNYDVLLTFMEKGSEPTVTSLHFKFSQDAYFNIKRDKHGKSIVEIPGHEIELGDPMEHSFVSYLLYKLLQSSEVKHVADIFGLSKKDVKILTEFMQNQFGITDSLKHGKAKRGRFRLYPELMQEKSIAPLRSKPRRTYDPITESPTSEGVHIPMLMMRLLRTKDKSWSELHDDLVEFGKQSGLFSEIKIKSHGKQINDPFQLQVKVRKGPQSNIMDVGYGVNQLLPILVEIIYSDETTFLLQQPEVHLHPRGQAEFATFLAKSVKKKKHSFLIETHSDYIIDRVRISVRDGIVKPEDVSILYFDPEKGGAVTIHNIEVDDQGNLKNVPENYRDFFMRETDRLLGFS